MSAAQIERLAADAIAAARLLRPVIVDDLADAMPVAPEFVIDKLAPRRRVTLLGAHGGAGKSVLALTLCAHVACGRTWGGFGVAQGLALFVSLEDEGELVRYRLRRIADAYGLDHDAIRENLRVVDGTESGVALAGEQNEDGIRRLLPTTAMAELSDAAEGCDFVVVDNASDAYDGSENDRRQVRAFMRLLSQLARETDAAVVLLAHVDKMAARNGSAGNTYSGSTAWHNSARSRLALVDDEGTVTLTQEKAQFSRPADPLPLRWDEHGVLMPLASADGFRRAKDDVLDLLGVFQAAAAAGADVSAARTGPTTAQAVLSTFPNLPAHMRGPKGRPAFWSALAKLQNDDKVTTREVRTASRHTRKVFCLTPAGELAQVSDVRANPPHPLLAYSAQGARECAVVVREFQQGEPAQTPALDNGTSGRLGAGETSDDARAYLRASEGGQ